ncbi:ATP-dependent helicase/deoxyribonuclease subunit B [Levilactobacillus zymae]|uniref:ATP-dependent helicase/deoxyribonuclease subunit B n=1 Tax=Levilactobacillus zymae TaxID=267363 RepID=A0ABQ0WXZ0_9LACO|nr:PD-(D/E)XK nuclease family protein [Levilactobacillus zymae]KRL12681.1 ATP-dependent nuclease, subunit B [Levilactobacillus zymae DSM 19395]QFR61989.1 ATP-dependent helicase [Levilactobacillus zymae]GEO72398.1 ATP-dependent helicase/deoxyribonuclease subunit B [Levilactobacillus zymae]
MSLQFVLGSAGRDHRTPMITAMAQHLTDQPTDQCYYLVPNHIKFETEVDVLRALQQRLAPDQPLFAQTQVQVFSFTRLAWFFMKNEPVYQLPRISPAGLNMLIYQIIQSHADELTIFRGEVTRPGFISQLTAQLSELRVGQVTASDLTAAIDRLAPGSADLQAKLHDLLVIYAAFETQMQGKYVANTDLLNQLADYLTQVDLSHAHFYLEGFSQLSAQERNLVTVLIQQAASVTIALNLDRAYPQELPPVTDLFFQSGKLYHQLYVNARANHVAVQVDQRAQTPRVSADLLALDDYWQTSNTIGAQPAPATTVPQELRLFEAPNRYGEVAHIANLIRRMVATGKYRYHDFLILTRHLDAYQTVIDPIFSMQEIPYFDDADVQMADHPFVELINALFDVQRRNYRYSDVFRVLKTALLLPRDADGQPIDLETYRQAVALTENFVLKTGFEGQRRWTQPDDWQYTRFTPGDDTVQTTKDLAITRQINVIRHFIGQTLPPFFAALKHAKTYTDAATILYQFLANHGVADQLMNWRDQAIANQDLTLAGQPEQTWQTFCQMLDECHAILGDLAFDQTDFQALLQAGFTGAKFSQIPSTLDQVMVSESGIVQANNRKVTFLMGATADTMPDNQVPATLLADTDRQELSAQLQAADEGAYLRDDAATQLAGEPYLNYLGFLSGSEQLIFSYPATNDGEADLQISPYLARIRDHFQLPVTTVNTTPAADGHDVQAFVGTRRTTLRHLVQASHASQLENQPLAANWLAIMTRLRQDPQYGGLTTKLLGSLQYRNVPTQLTPDIVTQLYGTKINTSISKLEEYYANPYAYFLKYGLRLQERDVFELSPASTGEFFHATLDDLIKMVKDQKLNLKDLDDDQLREMTDEAVAKVLDVTQNPQFAILESSERMGYIRTQLIKTMQRMAWTLQQQSQRTPLRPRKTEVQFGMGDQHGWAPLTFDLANHRQVSVRGRIDRLDQLDVNDKTYLGIVDYKSSPHQFSFQDAYYGQAMQMLTYLDAVKQNFANEIGVPATTANLAGAVYLHLQDPILKAAAVKDPNNPLLDLLKAERYQGLLLEDEEFLENVEELFQTKNDYSQLFQGLRKTSKGFTSSSKLLVTPEELDDLLAHTEYLIQQAATQIFAGKVDLSPVREQNKTALQYSPYKAIMQFDPLLQENSYHDLQPLKRDEVLKLIQAEIAKRQVAKGDNHE